MKLTRREILNLGAGVAFLSAFGLPTNVKASAESVDAAVKAFSGGADVADGSFTLTTPEIAENGNTVPIAVSIDSPMTAEDYVQSVAIYADGNPNAEVVTFNFTPASGVAVAKTRIRLAKTQNVVAVAKMSNGQVSMVKNQVKVTIGGCGG